MKNQVSVSQTRWPRQQTILLVDDEPSVRRLVRRLLERQGYQVLEAPDGSAAEAMYATSERPIDLILTDVRMPGISGPALVSRLLVAGARLRVLYISGYADEELIRHGTRGYEVLPKPFTPDTLVQKVRVALSGPIRNRPAAQSA